MASREIEAAAMPATTRLLPYRVFKSVERKCT